MRHDIRASRANLARGRRPAVLTNPDLPDRIMVVDDDPSVADVVGRYLVRDGHQVEYARAGRAALQRIAEQPQDLVVLDLMLPGIDGLEVCRQLRARWPIPVVMLTALGEETDRVVGLESGADRSWGSASPAESWRHVTGGSASVTPFPAASS